MWRRMGQAVGRTGPGLMSSPISWHPDGDWPHLRVLAEGALVIDRFPVEDAPVTARMARLLGGGLEALVQLHANELTQGSALTSLLIEQPQGTSIVWMDTFAQSCTPQDDIASLARIIADLDLQETDPVGGLAREWAEDPPPTAKDGIEILIQSLGSQLLSARHHLAVAGRKAHQQDRATRLASMVRRLASAIAPPQGRFCLKTTSDGVQVIVESEGEVIRGGAAAGEAGRFLPVVYTPDQGLDAQAARFLLRAWATRDAGDPLAREVAQATLGATDEDAALLIRWLSCMARVRAARLLLEAAHRGHRATA